MTRAPVLLSVGLSCALLSFAESPIAADFRGEGERFGKSCTSFSFSSIASCGELLFTDHPLHITAGSLAPGNGVGIGAALVGHWTTPNWRNTWDVDAVGSPNGSWRAGGYLNLVLSKLPDIQTGRGRPRPGAGASLDATREQPVIHLYGEANSLNKIGFYGIGPSTSDSARTWFGMRETITGASVVWPVIRRFNVALTAEANGRFVNTRGNHSQNEPSIEQRFSPVTAPGLFDQTAFAQFAQGIRIRPSFAGGHVQLDYAVNYREYIGGTNSQYSFRRFVTDVSHEFPLYRNVRSRFASDLNGPDECATSPSDTDRKCPPVLTRNLEGSVALRFFLSESIVPSGHAVPFYFQPTLGGTDINGNAMLPSFQDYRFRAPNVMFFRASFEHSIYKWPLGVTVMVDEGKVGLRRSDIDFSHLQHSYSAGLTLRAGGFPLVYLLFSWGGHEGTHTTASINSSLLGGGPRPSLF